jgi:hypothetical protein
MAVEFHAVADSLEEAGDGLFTFARLPDSSGARSWNLLLDRIASPQDFLKEKAEA